MVLRGYRYKIWRWCLDERCRNRVVRDLKGKVFDLTARRWERNAAIEW